MHSLKQRHGLASGFGLGGFSILLILCTLCSGISRGADVIINEILAANQSIAPLTNYPDYRPDYAELYNATANPINLGSGWTLSVKRSPDPLDPTDYFPFPVGTIIQPHGFLLVFFDNDTNYPGIHTTFYSTNGQETFTLKRSGDEVLLFGPTSRLFPVDSIIFGMQLDDYSIGRVPDFGPQITLTLPSPCGGTLPCGTNTPVPYLPAPTSSNEFSIKINEWVATNYTGSGATAKAQDDWFEVYNPQTNIVTLTGLVFVDEIPNLRDERESRPVPLYSFIAPLGFVRFLATGNNDADAPADEVAFSISSSRAEGDEIYMYASNKVDLLDHVHSSLVRKPNQSEGRIPDGGDVIITLPKMSPEDSNFGDITNVVINEVLAHTDLPLEDAIEFYNPGATAVDLSNFWLSNGKNNPMKYRLPGGSVVPARGYFVVYEHEFNPDGTGTFPNFTFNSANGDEAWLFSGNSAGRLTGYRVGVSFGASANGVSFGRVVNSDQRADFVPMKQLSLGTSVTATDPPDYINIFRSGEGATNPGPAIGPLVINEIHYHPPDILSSGTLVDNSVDEFIEIYNITDSTQLLYDNNIYRADRNYRPAPDGEDLDLGEIYADGRTNTWRLRGEVDFEFPENMSLGSGKFLLVVNFAPTNTSVLNSFVQRFGVPDGVQIIGPYRGKLGNGTASVELQRPDPPQGPQHPDFRQVPHPPIDRIRYTDKHPWPTNAAEGGLSPDGGGSSLQRISAYDYGNEPLNWRARLPTPGRYNTPSGIEAPTIATPPASRTVSAGSSVTFSVVARGGGLSYQWYYNDLALDGQTSTQLRLQNVSTGQGGGYYVVITNMAGSATSTVAQLIVTSSKPDSTKPTVQFVSPVAGANTNPVIVVTGKASDNIGVNAVYYSVNGGSFIAATGSVTYSVWGTPVPIPLVPGTNSVRSYALDQAGNTSLTITRTFFRSQKVPLSLSTHGNGGVTGATDQQMLDYGRNFSLTATPAPGNVFSNWVVYTNEVLAGYSTQPTLTYLMDSNLAIVANFVSNPFIPVTGKFNGLFFDTNDVQHGSSGFFTLTTTDRGSYTASFLHDNRKLSASGQFDLDGKATNLVTRTGTNALSVAWDLNLNGGDQVQGTVSDGAWTATLLGDRAVFNATTRPYTNAGKYTFTILGTPNDSNVPAGHGYGTMAIDANGIVKLSGFLADKGKAKQTVPLSKNGDYPLYIPFVKGSLISWVTFADRPTDDLHGLLNWHKLPSTKPGYYQSGFNEQTTLLGSRYVAPVGTNRLLSLANGQLFLRSGNLSEDYTNSFTLGSANKVANGGPRAMTLTFTPSTGLFKGNLTPASGAKPIAFNGAVLQKGTNGFGYALGSNQSSSVSVEPVSP